MHCLFNNLKMTLAATLLIVLPLMSVSAQASAAANDGRFDSDGANGANFTAVASQAISVKPTKDQAICLKREYSEDHLRQYPKQKLSSMYVILRKAKNAMAEPEDANRLYTFADVIGQNAGGNNEYYANLDAKCEFPADGKPFCNMACDEGTIDITPRSADVVISVAKETSFTLYRPGIYPYSIKSDDADNVVELEGTDKHNSSYRLYSAPVRECVEARKRAKRLDGNCAGRK